jgi:hypothetical protein
MIRSLPETPACRRRALRNALAWASLTTGLWVVGTPAAPAEPATLQVLDRSPAGVCLVFALPALETTTYEVGGFEYQTLSVPGGELHGREGTPCLPAFTRYVDVPAGAGVSVHVDAADEETLTGYRLLPMQAADGPRFAICHEIYALDHFLGEDVVTVGPPAVIRGRRVVPVTISPVLYNPATGEVRVVRRLDLHLVFSGVDLRNAARRPDQAGTRANETLSGDLIVAPGGSSLHDRPTTIPGARESRPEGAAGDLGTWLIIHRDDPQLPAILAPLIAWRERMGYRVVRVSTAQTGTTAEEIKAWIQNAYDTWEAPPEYIVLVGDAQGAFPLPTFFETYTTQHGPGDHGYVLLDGDDELPDAFIGRLSAEDYTTLQRIVYKIVSYESSPYIDDPSWFGHACLTGDPSSSGITCVHIQQWLKERLRQIGYAQVDTVFVEPFRSQSLANLNQGTTFFGYRGFAGVSGITVGDIQALQNGPRLTFGLVLTCLTGNWYGGTSINEAFLRGGAGTSTPTGGIGGISTAGATHTRYNNSFYAGVARGLFWDGHYQIGPAHARGKLEMAINYGPYEPDQAACYCYWNTLMGDPATELWTGYPEPLTVSYPEEIPLGATLTSVEVRDGLGDPAEGAWVYLWKEGQIGIGGCSGPDGRIDLPIDGSAAGEVLVTVTQHNRYPHQGSFVIATPDRFVGIHGYAIDDGTVEPAHGNGDGFVNPGETIALGVSLENFGLLTAPGVALSATCEDEFVELLAGGPIPYGDIPAGGHVEAPAPVVLAVDAACPPGHRVHVRFTIQSGADTWPAHIAVDVSGPDLVFSDVELTGVGERLDPGESGSLAVALYNAGTYPAQGPIQAVLLSQSYAVRVTDAYGTYDTIATGASGLDTGDPFAVSAPPDCIPGTQANLEMLLTFAGGIRDTVCLAITVGQAAETDPTGPDGYGYYAYDQTDTAYPQAPAYDWVDIAIPANSVGLQDFGDDQDDSRTLPLPFPFTFYGQTFESLTICSNGWLSMGQTYLVSDRNWYMPSAEGPANMIAGFWDDLRQSGSGLVYHWYDEANHRYVVSWDNVRLKIGWFNLYPESFQIILYDPAWYATPTGDGEIVMQYEVVNNLDVEQMFATVGIEDEHHENGLTFNYFAQRPPTAAPLVAGLAVRFTTGSPGFARVDPRPGLGPVRLELGAGPNPFRAATRLDLRVPKAQAAALRVYDVDGRLVRVLVQGAVPEGASTVAWDGADEQGRPVPAGIYYCRLSAGSKSIARTLTLLR